MPSVPEAELRRHDGGLIGGCEISFLMRAQFFAIDDTFTEKSVKRKLKSHDC